eukprot:jgi/Picsp_1/3719/NSC_06555-R1_---NA---
MEHLINSVEKLIEVVLSAGTSKSGEEMHGEKLIKSIISKWPVEEMFAGLDHDCAVMLSESSTIVRFMRREQLLGLVKGMMGPSGVKREITSRYVAKEVSTVDSESEGKKSDKFLTTIPEVSEDAVLDQRVEDSLVDAWSKELLTCATRMKKIENKTFRLDLSFWNQISDERKQSMLVNMKKKSFPKVSLYHIKVCMLSAALKLGCDVQPHEFSNIGVTICKQYPIVLGSDVSATQSAQSLSCTSEFSNSSDAILVDGIREEISKISIQDIEYGDLVILVAHNDVQEAEKGPEGVSMTIKEDGTYRMSHGFQTVALGVYQGDTIGLSTANGAVTENTCAVFLRDTFPCDNLRTFFRVYNNGKFLSTFISQKLHQQHRICWPKQLVIRDPLGHLPKKLLRQSLFGSQSNTFSVPIRSKAIKPSSPVLPMAPEHVIQSETMPIKKSMVMMAPEEEEQHCTETILISVSAAASCCSSPQQKRSIVMFDPEDEEINPSMCSVTASINTSPKESYKSKAKLKKERRGKENEMQGAATLMNRKHLTQSVNQKSNKLKGRDNNNPISRKNTPLVAIN